MRVKLVKSDLKVKPSEELSKAVATELSEAEAEGKAAQIINKAFEKGKANEGTPGND